MGELIVNGVKWAFIIGVSAVFMVALSNLLNLIVMVVFDNVVGEFLSVISNCLPFDASAVFGSISTAITGILAFMVGKKIYQLTTEHIKI